MASWTGAESWRYRSSLGVDNTTVTVNSSGQFTATLGSNTGLAIHTGKTAC